MKVKINKIVLDKMLDTIKSATEKKDESLITSHFLFEAGDHLTITATNNETGYLYRSYNAKIEKTGKATANAKKMLSIVKAFKNDDVILETKDNHLIVKQGRSRFKLPMFEADNFPDFPFVENKLKLDLNKFADDIKKVIPAIDTNNPKFELNGVLLSRNCAVASDTRRLAIVNTDTDVELIVPKQSIVEISKFREGDVFYNDSTILVATDKVEFFSKLINGKFPDFERIIPQTAKQTVKLNKDFAEALKQIGVISEEVRITITDKIIVESVNGDAKTEMEFDGNADISFGVNIRYLMDFINVIDGDFTLRFNESELPFMLEAGDFKTVVMPLMV